LIAAVTFLTPAGGLLALAALLPAAAFVLGAVRVRRVVKAVRLEPPRGGLDLVALAALVATVALLGLAATQPAIVRDVHGRERTDAQVLFVVDVSGSMAASASATSPTRLTRAVEAAERLRSAIPQVPAGVATLTDRVLPDLLPVADAAGFDATLQRAVGIEQPPPEIGAVTATSFAALGNIPAGNFFAPTARKRLVVLLTDGESKPFDSTTVADAFARTPPTGLITVRFGSPDEAIHLPDGRIDPGYHSDPESAVTLRDLAAATQGAAYDENRLGSAAAALRRFAGGGPTRATTVVRRQPVPLAPYVALASLLPLGFAARRRSRRFRAPAAG
jgi:hypothetical protein